MSWTEPGIGDLERLESRGPEDDAPDDAPAELSDLEAAVKLLAARVEWLEGRIRRTDPAAAAADLDTVAPSTAALALAAERGRAAAATLLPQTERTRLVMTTEQYAAAVARRDRQRLLILELSTTLASTGTDEPAHRAAAGVYGEARTQLRKADQVVAGLAPLAEQAHATLAVDDRDRATQATTVAEGEQAWTTLRIRLRKRLDSAVTAGALMPAWFTAALGPTAPPASRPADRRRWMDAALLVLLYRTTYGVDAPSLALGDPPADDDSPERHRWYQYLRNQLRELRR